MPHDVFISYSSIDKSAADTVCAILEQNGIPCWMAPRNITPGVPFAEAIIKAIKESKAFILIYSQNSNNSLQVIKEVDRAVHHGLAIITLRLEDVPMSDQLEYYLSDVHWLDALTPPLEKHISQLSGVVKMLLSKGELKDDEIQKAIQKGTLRLGKTGRPGSEKEKEILKWRITAAAAAIIVVILVAVLLVIPRLSKQEEKSIAVLPFTNLTNDTEQEYFVEGMHDEILDRIFKIGGLKVTSRTSSLRYKNSDLSLKEIARELGVTTIMEGSVRKIGNNVRITVQLIDAKTDTHLWSDIFDRDFSDIFSVQIEIAQAIARELQVVITPQEKALMENPYTASSEAYEAYLKGMYYWRKLTLSDLDLAMQYFELALEKDPEFALAWAGIAHVWTGRRQIGITLPSEATARGDEAITKALELDPYNAGIQYVYATHLVWGKFDWKGGEAAFRKTLEIDPRHAEAYAYYSHLLNIIGRTGEAMVLIEKALEVDPLSPLIWALYEVALTFARRYEEAMAAAERSFQLDPAKTVGIGTPYLLYFMGKEEEAFIEWRKDFKILENLKAIDEGYAAGGFREAHRRLADVQAERAKNLFIPPLRIAINYSIAGDVDNAIPWLEKAYEMRDPNLPYLRLPRYDQLRDDPRFRDLCRRLNLPYQ